MGGLGGFLCFPVGGPSPGSFVFVVPEVPGPPRSKVTCALTPAPSPSNPERRSKFTPKSLAMRATSLPRRRPPNSLCPLARSRYSAQLDEKVGEVDLGGVPGASDGSRAGATAARTRRGTEPFVVLSPLLGVREYFVSLLDLLEPFFCFGGAGVGVGVVLPRQPPVRLPYVVPGSLPGHTEQLVWVPGRHSARNSSLDACALGHRGSYPRQAPRKLSVRAATSSTRRRTLRCTRD